MKKIILKSCIVLTAMMGVSACDDFLDETVNGQLFEEAFYLTDEDAAQGVIAAYDMLGAEYNTIWASSLMIKTMPSDESNAGGANNGDQVGYQTLDDFAVSSQNDKVVAYWANLYSVIYRANKVLNNVEPGSDYSKRLLAEAKTLRAYAYFELVSLWGGVPIILDDVLESEFTTTKRATKDEVYALIEKDLTEAILVLPVKSDYDAADTFRWSKGAAQALLGKAHLYQGEWAAAVTAFNAVISSDEYALEESLQAVFDRTGEFGSESLFEFSFVSSEKYTWGNFPWGNRPESNIHVQLMGPREGMYTPMTGDSLQAGWGMNAGKKKMYDAFVAAGDVNRRRVTIFSKAELEAGGGKFVGDAWDVEGYWQRKYGSFAQATTGDDGATPQLNYSTNVRVIRYADVLLMAAEANFRNNDQDAARDLINQVRQRPGTNLAPLAVSVKDDALFTALVTERHLELAFEGFRYLDLVRWGLADEELGALGFQTGVHELLPIPYNDVNAYKLEQNPGY
ncbi:RagB/SusD family nutrient uptake outer membrane protein [Pseudochryseolinea flava]|uniref:RagB/SusD family nutrient uptake outer membrane protein n=1 Tax=Pseudochryseolinea flava TaxID=2059302 RepID=A0A364XWA6_9BACT|nr:RagB/SusD family nutrient uptake outer membrane protein [Pseudochryseolinea flava]RAV98637.1 RagB/SusD family nutrient uptake outer membrane protein [Pseudochryseolinea flava]